jgi:hypothetical protein
MSVSNQCDTLSVRIEQTKEILPERALYVKSPFRGFRHILAY